jgi:hypothetical protein
MKWDSNALWLKAKAYISRANEHSHESPDFAFWSSLSLELLARAALTKIHPTLNADPREDVNLLYACGFAVTQQPKSLPVHAVFLRLEKTVEGFGKVQRELCDYVSLLRNEELHTAELAFDNLKASKWLPRFYDVCKILCAHLGKSLEDFVGSQVGPSAQQLIAALDKEVESSVKGKIAAHAKVFSGKPAEEQNKLRTLADARSRILPYSATARECPACKSKGVLRGELIKELKPIYENESLLIDDEFLAFEFRCPACDLNLTSPAEIAHTTIEPRFGKRRQTDLHEMFEPDLGPEYENM